MNLNRRNSKQGLTRIEVLILIGVILIVIALFFPWSGRRHGHPPQCINNLKNIGLGFRQWAIDHDSRFPMRVSTNSGGTKEYAETGEVFRHFQILSNQIDVPRIPVCPNDVRKVARDFESMRNANVSYFVGLDADEVFPAMFLSGDRNMTNGQLLPNSILALKTNTIVGWTARIHQNCGNVLLTDSSVQSFSTRKLREALASTGVATNRLAFPLD